MGESDWVRVAKCFGKKAAPRNGARVTRAAMMIAGMNMRELQSSCWIVKSQLPFAARPVSAFFSQKVLTHAVALQPRMTSYDKDRFLRVSYLRSKRRYLGTDCIRPLS